MIRRPVACILMAASMVLAGCPAALCGWDGGSSVAGCLKPSRTWHFAEGCTRPGFEEYLCLFNPNGSPTAARLSCLFGQGERRTYDCMLPENSRTTVNINDRLWEPLDVSLIVESDLPVTAERSVYFRYQGSLTGGHSATGAVSASEEWYFAEGCTRDGFDTWLCIENPGARDALVDVFYHCADGVTETRPGVGVPSGARVTVPVFGEGPGIGRHNDSHGDVSIRLRSANGVPVVAERSMYFRYGGSITGGSAVVGAAAPSGEHYFAEGCTRDGFDTFISIQNPGRRGAILHISYSCGDGRAESTRVLRIPGRSRFTVAVHEPGLGIGRHNDSHGDVSIRLRSANGVPVVAERSMYFRYGGSITGGSAVVGAAAPSGEHYFAEGCTRDGFDTWLCLANPGRTDSTVTITYFRGSGETDVREGVRIPAGRRVTIPVHEQGPGIGRENSPRGDVSMRIESSNGVPVIAERTMYFSYRNRTPDWRAVDRGQVASELGWGEITRGDTGKRRVALTIDAGSEATYGNPILNALAAADVRCTFFVTGVFAERNPDIIRRMASEGHEIANHTYSHPRGLSRVPAEALLDQLKRCEDVVVGLTGQTTKPYFRFPYGERSAASVGAVNRAGYMSVFWTLPAEGPECRETAETIRSRITGRAGPGCIVLLHLDDPGVPGALPGTISDLRAAGLEPVTLTELIAPAHWDL